MCIYCNNERRYYKEVTFKSEIGIELSLCGRCLNSGEFGVLSKGYCEECKTFHNIENIHYEEYDGQYLCNECYWEALSEIEKQEQIEEEYYRLSK